MTDILKGPVKKSIQVKTMKLLFFMVMGRMEMT